MEHKSEIQQKLDEIFAIIGQNENVLLEEGTSDRTVDFSKKNRPEVKKEIQDYYDSI